MFGRVRCREILLVMGVLFFVVACSTGTPISETPGAATPRPASTVGARASATVQPTAKATATGPSGGAAVDCNIQWNAVLHDTFDPAYRSIVGPTTPGAQIQLRLRVAQGDITGARVRVWNDYSDQEAYYPMAWDADFDKETTTYDWWTAKIPAGANPTILYYFFEINDAGSCGADQDFYVDDDIKFYGGGQGAMSDDYDDAHSFQVTVYDPAFDTPGWMQRGVVYQIFPDRFRDGNLRNNAEGGRFAYGEPTVTIFRSNQTDWNSTICDPRGTYQPDCMYRYGDNFYGGDLPGITEKINQGYFDALGVSVIYLNPIFRSPSSHKYDTSDYMTIDPDFGTLKDFQTLAATAQAHGIKLILDGVFNHVSSDSRYFDRYHRYDANGTLNRPGGGTDDDSGACESGKSPFYSWFYFPDIGMPARDSGVPTLCINGSDDANQTYEAWYGYSSLPKLRANSQQVRALVWSDGLDSVGPYWVYQGASGWRFDVGGDLDPGLTRDPGNDYWEGFRKAVRNFGVTGKDDVLLLGEEWGDASPWLLGNEWDSVMNYRFRSAVLSWFFTGCSGNGCNNGVFQDNDSEFGSSSGAISYVSPSQFNARLRSIQEDYPPMAFKAMMNLEGSHDTNRLRFLLKKINNDSDEAALQRMKEWWLFSFTYAGAPTIYYGDEVGLSHDAVFANGKYEDDPYNRAPFPWPDAGGKSYVPDTGLQEFARRMASIRWSYRALQDGDVQHGLIIDDGQKLYGFARTLEAGGTALVALNRDGAQHTATFKGLNGAPYNLSDGTVLLEVIEGGTYTVENGMVSVPVNPSWGAVLLEAIRIESPVPVKNMTVSRSGRDQVLRWNPVTMDVGGEREVVVAYRIYRGTTADFTPAAENLVGTVTPPAFGSADGRLSYTDRGAPARSYYKIVPVNACGR